MRWARGDGKDILRPRVGGADTRGFLCDITVAGRDLSAAHPPPPLATPRRMAATLGYLPGAWMSSESSKPELCSWTEEPLPPAPSTPSLPGILVN